MNPITKETQLATEQPASREELRNEYRAIPVSDKTITEAIENVALEKGKSEAAKASTLECTRREGGRLVADELLEQQAARKLGRLPQDQLAASIALEKETPEHCSTCDSPTEECKHLHEPMVAEIIITDRDTKPHHDDPSIIPEK